MSNIECTSEVAVDAIGVSMITEPRVAFVESALLEFKLRISAKVNSCKRADFATWILGTVNTVSSLQAES